MITSPNHSHESVDILWIYAHPDDEAFGSSGLMMLATDRGYTSGVICATRGESGEIANSALADPVILGAVRERELRQAMRLAGVSTLRLLPYRDSGMAGTPENDDPRALTQAPERAVVADVVGYIRELQPRAIVTFGPDGIYGHPDHVAIGTYATVAATVAGESDALPGLGDAWRADALYHVALPREVIREVSQREEGPFSDVPDDVLKTMGTPSREITHWFDVSAYAERKHAVIMSHATQVGNSGPSDADTNDETRRMLGREQYVRVPLPWQEEQPTSDPFRDWLDAAASDGHPQTGGSPDDA